MMKWESMSIRDRIAAHIYVSMMHTSTEPIIFVPEVWSKADKITRKKCRACANTILSDIGIDRERGEVMSEPSLIAKLEALMADLIEPTPHHPEYDAGREDAAEKIGTLIARAREEAKPAEGGFYEWPCDKCGGPMSAPGYFNGDVVLRCKCGYQKTIKHDAWIKDFRLTRPAPADGLREALASIRAHARFELDNPTGLHATCLALIAKEADAALREEEGG